MTEEQLGIAMLEMAKRDGQLPQKSGSGQDERKRAEQRRAKIRKSVLCSLHKKPMQSRRQLRAVLNVPETIMARVMTGMMKDGVIVSQRQGSYCLYTIAEHSE